jgi:hypothetical protein
VRSRLRPRSHPPDPRRRRLRLARRRPPRSGDRRRPGAAARAASLRVPLAVRGGRLGGAVPTPAHRPGRPPAVTDPGTTRPPRTPCRAAAPHPYPSDLVPCHGDDGALPAPDALRTLDLDLPGRKAEYLHAVAEAALDGRLDGAALRAVEPKEAVATVRKVKGLGPFAAELVVLRGANAPDGLPTHERRLDDEVTERYGRRSPRSRSAGGRSAPGPRCICAPCASSAHTRSAADPRSA